MLDCCIIIPCYNEYDRILKNDFTNFLENNRDFHFVFVDDGSVDDTFLMLQDLSVKNERISCFRLDKNHGKAEAVRFGMNKLIKSDFSFFGFIDADLAIPLDELSRLHMELTSRDNIDFVYASKNTKLNTHLEMKVKRFWVGRILSFMVRRSLKVDIYDTQCGCKIMTKEISEISFKEKFISSWLFDIEIFWRIIKKFGRDYIRENTLEIPLEKLYNRGDSKVSLAALIKLPLEFLKIHRYYSRKT